MTMLANLFAPGNIGTIQTRNRIIMAPMGTLFPHEDGTVSDRTCRYYEERARGGAGLIIVEIAAVSREGKGHARVMGIHGDEFIPGLRRLVETVHRHGVPIVQQIYHAGRQTTAAAAGGQPVAPSAIPCPLVKAMPRELTVAEIEGLIDAFAAGARRAKEAGFDGVELHGAHGYLLCQFLSPYSNQRTDAYGGSLEGRMRFPLDVVARVKETVGHDFPLLYRLSAEEDVPGGLTLDETRIFAKRLQDAGVHVLDVSAGNYGAVHTMIQPGSSPRGCLAPLAAEIKKVVDIPVTVAGRMNDPVLADAVIREGKADFISLGRPLLADPEYPNKAKEGRFEDIRMCTACYHCFDMEFARAEPLHCAINASAGREAESELLAAPKAKRVIVIGGGPGGMEAARVAALRGHTVTLYEKEPDLGGQLLTASLPPGKNELATTIFFLQAQLVKAGVEVKRGHEADVEAIVAMKPDAVVLATGSSVAAPDIPGADTAKVVMARDVIAGRKEVGGKVVIVGGGRVGCETALLLAGQGKNVTLVRMAGRGRLAGDVGILSRRFLLRELRESPVTVEADSSVEAITPEGVVITKNGVSMPMEADTVVLSPAPSPDNRLAEELRGRVPELHVIGDAEAPRTVAAAIHEGFRVGREL